MEDNCNILVVEDNQLNKLILGRILKKEGYNVVEADNGREALDILLSGMYEIKLILLDLMMPVMDGYEFLGEMNANGLIKSIPVIVTTINDDLEAEIRCLESGASDYIIKPFNSNIVMHRVKSILRLFDNASLISQLETDKLTGLYTKEAFYRHAEPILRNNPDKKYEVLFCDIENFKLINSRYGIGVGDAVLRYIAQMNRNNLRDDEICCRIGADTFAVLQERRNVISQDEMMTILSRNLSNAPVANLSLKYGIYCIDDSTIPISAMCDRAKLALNSIKKKYGKSYAYFDESMTKKAIRENQIIEHMEEALRDKQFILYLQPKHGTSDMGIAGAEALVRWIHPTLGFIPPGDFISLFERTGFVGKLDLYMLRESCMLIRRWIGEGIEPVSISVNLSRVDFEDSFLIDKISDIVNEYDVPIEYIHFEVTESSYTDNPEKIIEAVSLLRDRGFIIEMDDFGTGYSSLNMLAELPIDILKLDMQFIRKDFKEVTSDKRNILSFVVSLSKWLQLPTIAEGVETQAEYELLKSIGCDFIQGYYFSKPISVEEFDRYLLTYNRSRKKIGEEYEPYSNPQFEDTDKPLVLVVEDIHMNCEILRELLKERYRVQIAYNGVDALEFIMGNYEDISCMLLDLLMPVMDGFKLVEELDKENILGEIPIVITTEAGDKGEVRALRMGAVGFVPKPYDPELIHYSVRHAVEIKRYKKLERELNKTR